MATIGLVTLAACNSQLVRTLSRLRSRLEKAERARNGGDLARGLADERRYRNLLESLGHLIFLADGRGTLNYFNGRWAQYLGIQPSVDESFYWRRLIHPDDRESLTQAWQDSIRTRSQFKSQFRLRRFDGSFRWQMAQAIPAFDAQGNLIQWIGSVTEIDEQHQANERFQSIFRQAPVVMAFFRGPRFLCEQATPLARRLFGDGIERGRSLRETFPELEGQGLLEWMEHVYRTGDAFNGTEYPALIPRGDGSSELAYFNLVLQPTRNAEQSVDGVMVLGADVTELVQARKRLEESETRLRRLIDSNIIGIFFLDASNGAVIDANDAFLNMTGYTREDLQMGRLSRSSLSPPEYAAIDERASRQLRQSGTTEVYEKEYMRRDGSRVPIMMAAALFDESTSHGVAWVLDLSESKRTERELQIHRERLDLVIDSMKVGVWYSDVPFTQLKCNATLREHFWFGENEEVTVTSWYSRLANEDRQRVEDAVRRCLLQGVDYDEIFQVRQPGAEGVRWIRAVGKSYRATSGCVMRFDGITLDVTQQVLAERELHRALRSRDEFISVASHELRTPLTSMKLQIQAMKRGFQHGDPQALAPERMGRMLDQSDRQILRLTRLIDDMLEISRIQTGHMTLRCETIELGGLVQDVVERMAPQLERAGCPVHGECSGTVMVNADRYRLEQVVMNLLSNACRHGAGHPIEITLAPVGDRAQLSITDHGNGIAEEDQERIFRRYERAAAPTESTGLGIGLCIAHQIMEMHGGQVKVRSRLGHGATFTVTLPLRDVEELAHAR